MRCLECLGEFVRVERTTDVRKMLAGVKIKVYLAVWEFRMRHDDSPLIAGQESRDVPESVVRLGF